MGVKNDWKVLQTAEEIRQLCWDQVYSELTYHEYMEPPPTPGEQKWAEKIADRISHNLIMHFDADEQD